ncbi:MAG TPA: fumarylacetoacetate hydrolase family protein [Vicinamibacterales bacterium]|nr:fumarylacetoacetate hydrolase family protein [Vicinamibacterales bacterium]
MDRIYRARQGMGGRYVLEREGTFYWMGGDPFGDYWEGREVPTDERLTWLAPVRPSIVVAIGLNYKDHASEMNKKLPEEPLVFLKPPSSVAGPDEPVRLPAWAGRIEHEAEMAVVIGRTASRVAAADAMRYVLGVTCLCDVTARELQVKDVQYSRAKGFDTFAPLGPCIAVGLDPSNLAIEGWVNGERRHQSNTDQLIFPVPVLIEHVTRFMTLQPGDIITTGTPSGVGALSPGDRVMVKVEGVGTLSNPCVAA